MEEELNPIGLNRMDSTSSKRPLIDTPSHKSPCINWTWCKGFGPQWGKFEKFVSALMIISNICLIFILLPMLFSIIRKEENLDQKQNRIEEKLENILNLNKDIASSLGLDSASVPKQNGEISFTYALSFYNYRSQNILYRSKFFEPVQKSKLILALFKIFCACPKTKFTERKSSFGETQNVWNWPTMYINFWCDPINLDKFKIFWDL